MMPPKNAPTFQRAATLVRMVSIAVIAACLAAIIHFLPIGRGVHLLQGKLLGWGIYGQAAFIGIYILATVLFIPGSALTLAAGAIYGLFWGTLLASTGATAGACLAYLIARYALRRRVQMRARQYPRFAAIERAIGQSGWKIVALVRLAPVFPFILVNYLFGLTPIGFLPYALTTWFTMLPGGFLYVYLGYTAGQAIQGAGSATDGGWPSLILKIVGLAATALVVVLITRIAKRALASQVAPSAPASSPEKAAPKGWPRNATVLLLLALFMLVLSAFTYLHRESLAGLIGPPPVKLVNKFHHHPHGPRFNNSLFNMVVKQVVHPGGWVDYARLAARPQKLAAYIQSLAKAPFARLGRNQKLALLLNAYNACTLRLILDYYPHIKSIKDIPAAKRWEARRWNIGGKIFSLERIEWILRSDFADPQIHFAIVCASIGCPPLRRAAYEAATVNRQLHQQAILLNNNPRWVRLRDHGHVLHLTMLYDWYAGDFRQAAGSVLKFVARYNKPLAAELAAGRPPRVEFMNYNWNLNCVKNQARYGGHP